MRRNSLAEGGFIYFVKLGRNRLLLAAEAGVQCRAVWSEPKSQFKASSKKE